MRASQFIRSAILVGHDLSFRYEAKAIFRNVNFSLSQGSAMLLTGANGTGKSTLLRVIAGLDTPSKGTLLWNGEPMAKTRPAFQHPRLQLFPSTTEDGLMEELTLAENLEVFTSAMCKLHLQT
eukprot:TRINITY_DN699_c1_g1_i1.p2 TRINITY_DN699_c1_g1~~TRINITY_DN699_c1_g1_i1.p2  ORF type:complete len:123 (+),score=23.55 TRINITY_DN699_c1_g1_i1:22-390(+)